MGNSVSGTSGASRPPKFKFDESFKLKDVDEPSGLAYVPELDRFVAVSDSTRDVALLDVSRKKLRSELVPSAARDGISDFEGVAYDPERKRLVTVSERSRRIRTFQVLADERRGGGAVELRETGQARVPALGKDPNKGLEGLAFLPAHFAPDGRSHLVAVHEADPKAVLLIDPDSLQVQHQLALPKKWDEKIQDLSDVAVDPLTGHLFLLSDESRQILELELRTQDEELDLAKVQRFDVEAKGTGKIRQPEGIAFDGQGNLYLTAEGSRRLYRYQRQ